MTEIISKEFLTRSLRVLCGDLAHAAGAAALAEAIVRDAMQEAMTRWYPVKGERYVIALTIHKAGEKNATT